MYKLNSKLLFRVVYRINRDRKWRDETICESLISFHIIYGKSFNGRCEITVNDKVKADDLHLQAKYVEMILQHFYNRFNKEYILALLERNLL